MTGASSSARPWYREGMVWLVIAIPATAVVLGVAMLTIAVSTWDGLVVDDYYKHGKEINRVLVRDRFSSEHGIRAHLEWSVPDGRLSVSLLSDDDLPAAPAIELRFLHPTRSGMDQAIDLARGPDGRYHGVASPLREGGWIVQLGTEKWRLSARAELRGGDPLSIRFEPLPEG